jgi:hypothetical protein
MDLRYCLGQVSEAKNDPMPDTAKTLRDRIAHLRRLISGTVDVDVARNYLNEIVMVEMQLHELEAHENEKKKAKKTKPRSDR